MDSNSWIFVVLKVLAIIVLPMYFCSFSVKYIMKYVIEERKSGMPYFLYLSLLLSTTILNNKTVP